MNYTSTESSIIVDKVKYQRNDNNLAIVYARYSSHSQNDASIAQQLEAAHRYADINGLQIIKEYADHAISGRSEDRPEFNLMLSEVKKLKPAHLILWKGDRLARNRTIATLAKHHLKKAGCFPVYLTENFDAESVEGELLEGILESVASFQAKQSIVNIERGMTYNASNCLCNGSIKYGYTVNKETKKYEIQVIQAEIVKKIFESYDNGMSLTEIANNLNIGGLTTLRGLPWRVDSVAKILKNRTYLGIYIWGDHEIEGGMPQIVDKELFERCQKRLQENRHHRRKYNPNSDYWMTPKLICGHCGSIMSGAYGKSATNGKTYYYYRCTNKECSVKNKSKKMIEKAVIDVLEYVTRDNKNLKDEAARQYKENHRDNEIVVLIENLNTRLTEINTSINNLISAIEKGLISEATQSRLLELEHEKRIVSAQLQAEEAKASLFLNDDDITDFISKFDNSKLSKTSEIKHAFDYYVAGVSLKDKRLFALIRYSSMSRKYAQNTREIVNDFDELRYPVFTLLPGGELVGEDSPRLHHKKITRTPYFGEFVFYYTDRIMQRSCKSTFMHLPTLIH